MLLDSSVTCKVTCIGGILDTVVWGPDELSGDFADLGFADTSVPNPTTGESTAQWTKIDFSGNKELVGIMPRWLAGAGKALKHLNLSGTRLSGQLPRFDILLPNLQSLDVSKLPSLATSQSFPALSPSAICRPTQIFITSATLPGSTLPRHSAIKAQKLARRAKRRIPHHLFNRTLGDRTLAI
jgi:hypothetical protein